MDYFNLPAVTSVQKVVPKNAFDDYTNTKQKKLFTDSIHRITWTNKISKDTTNLPSKEIQEIQLFYIELKIKSDIQPMLDIIDKSIPYPIIFKVRFNDEMYLSTSTKHPHPINEDNSVIDWTFKTDWFNRTKLDYTLNLKISLDAVYKDFCIQLSGKPELSSKPLSEIIINEQELKIVNNEINKLKAQINKCKQFNKKVELNLELKNKETELRSLIDK